MKLYNKKQMREPTDHSAERHLIFFLKASYEKAKYKLNNAKPNPLTYREFH
jgi:hypothetical protein